MTLLRHLTDRRSDEEKKTHTKLVGGYDTCLSGWGNEIGQPEGSWAFWACTDEQVPTVLAWIKTRDEFRKIRLYTEAWAEKKSIDARVSIYVITDDHRYADKKILG